MTLHVGDAVAVPQELDDDFSGLVGNKYAIISHFANQQRSSTR